MINTVTTEVINDDTPAGTEILIVPAGFKDLLRDEIRRCQDHPIMKGDEPLSEDFQNGYIMGLRAAERLVGLISAPTDKADDSPEVNGEHCLTLVKPQG